MREQVTNCDLIFDQINQIKHCELASKINYLIQKNSKNKFVTWVMAFVFMCLLTAHQMQICLTSPVILYYIKDLIINVLYLFKFYKKTDLKV